MAYSQLNEEATGYTQESGSEGSTEKTTKSTRTKKTSST